MGTWHALAIPFPPCLSRKRQSWEHGCACESLFSLPVEEKAVLGCLRSTFPRASRGKGLPRDSAGLRGWGAHGAPQCSEGLRGAPEGSVAWNCLSFDRQGEMAITGTLVWGVVQDCLFTDRQREKGWRVPRGNPPFSASVLSMSRPREALFPRQAEGKRHLQRGSAGEASVGKQSFPKHRGSKHAQPKGRRILAPRGSVGLRPGLCRAPWLGCARSSAGP